MKKGVVGLLAALLAMNIFAGTSLARDFNDLPCDYWAYSQIQSWQTI